VHENFEYYSHNEKKAKAQAGVHEIVCVRVQSECVGGHTWANPLDLGSSCILHAALFALLPQSSAGPSGLLSSPAQVLSNEIHVSNGIHSKWNTLFIIEPRRDGAGITGKPNRN